MITTERKIELWEFTRKEIIGNSGETLFYKIKDRKFTTEEFYTIGGMAIHLIQLKNEQEEKENITRTKNNDENQG